MAVRVQREDFDVAAELGQLGNIGAGALCVFIGQVRDFNEGRTIAALTLERYPGMAERELARLEAEARRRWPLSGVLVVHRFGRLAVGERIVLVAVSSARRDDAFTACRFLIDQLKTSAPFWKAEETDTGRRWLAARAEDSVAARRWGVDEGKKNRGARTYRALIFDFDGVIVESELIKSRAFDALYRQYGTQTAATAVAHHEANGGISRRKKIRHLHKTLLGIDLDDAALEMLCRRFSSMVEDEVVACEWVPGARELLARQVGLRPMFIVSGTPHDELQRIVDRRGIADVFTEVHGSPPDKAETIRAILDRHALEPGTVLFIGDGAADWRAARETAVPFVGRVPDDRPSPFPPGTSVISDLTQLPL